MVKGDQVTLLIDALDVGAFSASCYVVRDEGARSCMVIDPGGDADRIIELLESLDLMPTWILLTHCHFDHIQATDLLCQRFPDAVCAAHSECARRVVDPFLNLSALIGHQSVIKSPAHLLDDEACVTAGGLTLIARHTPGHAPGHLAFHDEAKTVLFSGDVLFAGSIGRSDFDGSDAAVLQQTLHGLMHDFGDETKVYPGHGPATTIGRERRTNPFVLHSGDTL